MKGKKNIYIYRVEKKKIILKFKLNLERKDWIKEVIYKKVCNR